MQAEPYQVLAGARRADVRDMAIVHRAYRREFALAPQILRELLPREPERRAAAVEWFGVMLDGRAPRELLDHMERQHRLVEQAVAAVRERLDDWERGTGGSAPALAAAYEA